MSFPQTRAKSNCVNWEQLQQRGVVFLGRFSRATHEEVRSVTTATADGKEASNVPLRERSSTMNQDRIYRHRFVPAECDSAP